MWSCNSEGVFQSELLSRLSWLDHGFGSRRSEDWPGIYASSKQIHSAIVNVARDDESTRQGDALVTDTPGLRIGIRTADCVPILLADPLKRAVGAIHAGWRGTAGEIARHAVEQMQRTFGSDASQLYAAIGPCIAQCCFEVGPEVAAQFREFTASDGNSTRVDLAAANLRQLIDAGLDCEQVDIAGLCTMCDPMNFHSFRRDKDASGRMVAAITIRGQ